MIALLLVHQFHPHPAYSSLPQVTAVSSLLADVMDLTIANLSQLNIHGGNIIQAGGNVYQTHIQNELRPGMHPSLCSIQADLALTLLLWQRPNQRALEQDPTPSKGFQRSRRCCERDRRASHQRRPRQVASLRSCPWWDGQDINDTGSDEALSHR
jgi:hypothetical protein